MATHSLTVVVIVEPFTALTVPTLSITLSLLLPIWNPFMLAIAAPAASLVT
jgi:hypothetical protein